jgi:hypothetical protein
MRKRGTVSKGRGQRMRRITIPADVAAAPALVDKMMRYPLAPTYRGSYCPPAPFGQATTHARINTASGGEPEYPLTSSAEAVLDGGATVLTPQETTDLQAIAAGGEPIAETQVNLEDVELWIIGNNSQTGQAGYRCRLIGYSAAQTAANYGGPPHVSLDFPGDLGHGVAVTADDRLIIAPGWNVNANHLGLYAIEASGTVDPKTQFAIEDVESFSLDIYDPTAPNSEPRMAGHWARNGKWLVGTIGGFSLFNESALVDGVVTSQVLSIPGTDHGNVWDTDYDAEGNLWWVNMLAAANGQNGVRMITRARYEAGFASGGFVYQPGDKVFSGTNFANADGIAVDGVGGFWLSQWGAGPSDNICRLAYWTPAQVAAASHVPSNPNPARVLTWPAPNDDSSGICLTNAGDLWQTDWTYNVIRKFSAAQLAAGGLQTPVVTITIPYAFRPWIVRTRASLAHHVR